MEIGLAALLVLSFPVIAVAVLVIAVGARGRARSLEQCFADFQGRQRDPIRPFLAALAAIPSELLPPPPTAAASALQ